jgi:hypothetical protein
VPDPTLLILQPTAGATVPTNFPANGQVDPASTAVSGETWNRNTNVRYPSAPPIVQPDGSWTTQFLNIPPDTPYSLQAWVTNTAVLDQHDNITVQ